MRRELIDVVSRKFVALDKQRTFFRHADVPAHKSDLRNYLSRFAYEFYHFIPKRDFESFYGNARHRVLFVKVARFVKRGINYLAAVFFYRHNHAAAVEVVNVFAVAYAQICRNDACFAVLRYCYDTAGVDRIGVQAHKVGVLNNGLFKQHEICFDKMLAQRFNAVKIGKIQLLNTFAAHSVFGLCHKR